MLLLDQKFGYQDELKATGLMIGVTIIGSFFVLDKLTQENQAAEVLGVETELSQSETESVTPNNTEIVESQPTTPPEVPAQTKDDLLPINDVNMRNSEVVEEATTAAESKAPKPKPATLANGADQRFENDAYIISFSKSQLLISQGTQAKVEVVIANKSVDAGLKNKLFGVIERDGEVISSTAPMTVSENKTIMPGQKLTFTASISLPKETDLTKIVFDPGDLELRTTYNLGPSL